MESKKYFFVDEIHVPIILRDILINGWLVLLAAAAVCMGIFSYSVTQHQPVYTTEATFVVSPRSNGAYVGFYSSLSTANEMAGVFREVFASDVLKRLIREDLQDPKLSFTVSSSVAEGTNILVIQAQADSPEHAHAVIQSVLRNYRKVSGYLFGSVVLDILKNPQISVTPSNPFHTKKFMVLGAFLAGVLVVMVIVLISVMRPTTKTLSRAKRQMEEAPLGILQREKTLRSFRWQQKRPLLITDTGTSFRYTESMLQLAHKIRHKMKAEDMKVLLITSVAENEGKSTVSANLALALAQHGQKVAYVDMDLRKPAVHKIFGKLPQEELLTCLENGLPASLDTDKRLHILSCSQPSSAPDRLLHSRQLADLLAELREKVDFVILDSSPYMATADTGMLLQHADCCVMVLRQDWAPSQICRDVAEELDEGKAKYLGYIINHYLDNGVAKSFDSRYGKNDHYAEARSE